jgi:hypothetical protein
MLHTDFSDEGVHSNTAVYVAMAAFAVPAIQCSVRSQPDRAGTARHVNVMIYPCLPPARKRPAVIVPLSRDAEFVSYLSWTVSYAGEARLLSVRAEAPSARLNYETAGEKR